MSERPSGAKHLTVDEYGAFLRTYCRHLNAMGASEREKYDADQIKRIKRNFKKRCFEVYFKNGDWWHYTLTGEWY